MNPTVGWLLYRLVRMYCGRTRGHLYAQAKKRWRRHHPLPRGGYVCVACQLPIPSGQLTMDHIIPLKVIYDLELDVGLIWDIYNLQPMHGLCNTLKADTYTAEPRNMLT